MIQADVFTLLGCPQCTFNRYLPSWYLFTLLRLAAVCVVVYPRLDAVRVLAVACLLELAYFFLWRHGVIGGYREVDFHEAALPVEWVGRWFSWFFELGVIHLGVLAGLARVGVFRVKGGPEFPLRKAAWVVPWFFGIHALQLMVASATSSRGF